MAQMTMQEYLGWFKEQNGYDYESAANRNRFNTNIKTIQGAIANNSIILEIEKKLEEWSDDYEKTTGSMLFMYKPSLQFSTKTYESTLDKIFRLNCLWNRNFPEKAPKSGWITPENIFAKINDLIRTCLVCKFIDGPIFLSEKLADFCKKNEVEYRYYSQERDEGYYAYHFYINFGVQVLDTKWKEIDTTLNVEIQFTTQLQEVLKELTHQYFEISRLEPKSFDNKWKWEVDSNRFRSAYMCHTLHLLEAIILDLRKKGEAE